jgi:hypothetical protein
MTDGEMNETAKLSIVPMKLNMFSKTNKEITKDFYTEVSSAFPMFHVKTVPSLLTATQKHNCRTTILTKQKTTTVTFLCGFMLMSKAPVTQFCHNNK